MPNKPLQIEQLDSKIKVFAPIVSIAMPPTGWIKAIRSALSMSLEQMGKKLNYTRQAAKNIENREKDGTITINSLKEVARVMDMQFVYGFVPKDGSLQVLIDRKALELATQIVMRTSNSMKLEDQENRRKRLVKAIDERANSIKNDMPKILWD